MDDEGRPAPSGPRITFDRGTLLLEGIPAPEAERLPGALWDPRVGRFRAPAWRYAEVAAALARRSRSFQDGIRSSRLPPPEPWGAVGKELRPYQHAALTSWRLAGRRGIVVLPTGSGKTRVAAAAMAADGARVLCLVPTRVLLHQWVKELSRWYRGDVGRWGDGQRRLAAITVCTFASAVQQASRFGALFELLVIDEVHHFGARLKDEALEMSTAPARLGLTATLPADPIQAERLTELVGPVAFRLAVGDLAGTYLASFDLVVLRVSLDGEERRRYAEEIAVFRQFHAAFRRSAPGASWQELAAAAARTVEGRRAMASWRRARRIGAFPRAKRALLGELLARHRNNRVLVFTPDNDTAYEVAREHLVMPLTCDIQRAERDDVLERFRRGQLRALVSSRVLNEGLDVPDADVAIVVGGALGEREHVQRVGRLLRPAPGKRAVVYELVASGTSESWMSARRRRALGAGRSAAL